eukprot:scaffold79290_cov41-Attheya_sp.AAC.1
MTINRLLKALQGKFNTKQKFMYMMVAPNTHKTNDCAAHGHKMPYFFAPPEKADHRGFAEKKDKKRK